MPIQRTCGITAAEKLNHKTVSLWLEAGELAREATAGQFVHVRCGDALLLRRPISVCQTEGDRLNLVFEMRGEGTAWLADRRVGETLDVLGPLGHGFSLPEGKILVVGGGIGAPPLLGAVKDAPGGAIACLGFRSREQAILLDQFRSSCEALYLASDDGSLGIRGFAADAAEAALTDFPEVRCVLACGPRRMLHTVYAVAKAHGVPCQVSMEERMGCGVGACLVCACKSANGRYVHVCKDGPVFDAEEVCWDE